MPSENSQYDPAQPIKYAPQAFHPTDGESTPLLQHKTPDSDPAQSPKEFERRPSFIGFNLMGSTQIRQSKENDKLINYYHKSGRIPIVRELRPQKLIGDIGRLFDWSGAKMDDTLLKMLNNKKLKQFYLEQNELIEKYEEVDKLLDSRIHHNMIRNYSERNDQDSQDQEEEDEQVYQREERQRVLLHRRESAVPGDIDLETGNLLGYNKSEELYIVNLAITVNFFANIVLLVGKLIVAILTSSISIVASVLDSALDFLSTLIIFFSNRMSQTKHSKDFPVGKNRLEPLGVLVFSIIIIICFIQVGMEAGQRLIHGGAEGGEVIEIGSTAVVIMVLTIVTKLACYFWCKSIKSSSVEALTQDALVDVVFNSFSILMPVLGYAFQIWWFDALGALLLSCYIVFLWSITGIEHITNLTGKNAERDDYQVVLYLCMRFAQKIDKIKDINCYHVGDAINIEVDLVLDPTLGVKDTHDIAEALQYTLEALPIVNVERAFVHIDYTVGNFKGHLQG